MRSERIAEGEIFLNRPAQPCRPDQPGLGRQLAVGDVAVVKGLATRGRTWVSERVEEVWLMPGT